jgi:hypothetical protein
VSVGSSHFNARVTGVVVSDGSDDFVAPDTWYRRWDNNGWRLVTSTEDTTTREQSARGTTAQGCDAMACDMMSW